MIPPRRALLAAAPALVLFWAPLPWGSVTPAAELALRLAAFAGLVAAVLLGSRQVLDRVAVPALAMCGLAALGWLQAAGWPEAVVGRVSPEHLELHRAAQELAGEAGEGRPSLSLSPPASRDAALGWAMAAAALVAGAGLAGSRRRRRWLAASILLAALVQVVYGSRIWRLEESGRLRGTFVNSDHLAVYLEIALAISCAWGWWATVRARGEPLERKLAWIGPPILVGLVILAGLAYTGSRSGLAAAVVGVLTASLAAARRPGWKALAAGVLAAGAGLATVATVGLQKGLGRSLATSLYEVAMTERFAVWKSALGLVRRFPWTGTGLGTFLEGFPLVQPAEMTGTTWNRAHNDPLELLVTGGPAAAALALVGLVWLTRALWRVRGVGARSETRAAAIAALAALAAVGFHELLDFGLTLPANAFTFALFAGAAAAGRVSPPRAAESAAPAPASRAARRAA